MVESITSTKVLGAKRAGEILSRAESSITLVVGDVMLDRLTWGTVRRISPEAPVPVVNVEREEAMPGGAANVARNISALRGAAEIFGAVGKDDSARELEGMLRGQGISCYGLIRSGDRHTTVKNRIIAHKQQIVRVDRETVKYLDPNTEAELMKRIDTRIRAAGAVIVCDYGKGVVSQSLLGHIRLACGERRIPVNLDPKPAHYLVLGGLNLITPNRSEAFEMAGVRDGQQDRSPTDDPELASVSKRLIDTLNPNILLITLGENGMLLCQQGKESFHVPTAAKAVYDVSGAGDTVIATFTLAMLGGAAPIEAAVLSNHAAGIVVGKVGTAVASKDELLGSLA